MYLKPKGSKPRDLLYTIFMKHVREDVVLDEAETNFAVKSLVLVQIYRFRVETRD